MTAVQQKWDEPRPVRLTVEDFELLDRSGAFDAYARTELIDGVIVALNSQYVPHATIKSELAFALRDALREAESALKVVIEVSVRAGSYDEPMPDIAVAEPMSERIALPVGKLKLAVEVADSTLAFDLGPKARLYATAGVPECWIVDINGREVHRLSDPRDGGYVAAERIPFGQRLASATLPGVAVALDF